MKLSMMVCHIVDMIFLHWYMNACTDIQVSLFVYFRYRCDSGVWFALAIVALRCGVHSLVKITTERELQVVKIQLQYSCVGDHLRIATTIVIVTTVVMLTSITLR